MIRHILEKYGSSDATLNLLVQELEEHLSEEECEELSKQIYESTQGQHFDECFARKQISKMYYTDSDGRHRELLLHQIDPALENTGAKSFVITQPQIVKYENFKHPYSYENFRVHKDDRKTVKKIQKKK